MSLLLFRSSFPTFPSSDFGSIRSTLNQNAWTWLGHGLLRPLGIQESEKILVEYEPTCGVVVMVDFHVNVDKDCKGRMRFNGELAEVRLGPRFLEAH